MMTHLGKSCFLSFNISDLKIIIFLWLLPSWSVYHKVLYHWELKGHFWHWPREHHCFGDLLISHGYPCPISSHFPSSIRTIEYDFYTLLSFPPAPWRRLPARWFSVNYFDICVKITWHHVVATAAHFPLYARLDLPWADAVPPGAAYSQFAAALSLGLCTLIK